MNTEEKYPALMAYITARSSEDRKTVWKTLREHESAAIHGQFADVAENLERAQSDYASSQHAKGLSGYPYNSAMGIFLGLSLGGNNEPPVGYYISNQVMHHYRLGAARREIESLLSNGAQLRTVASRDKKTGRPLRFTTFNSSQITVEGDSVVCQNGRQRVRLSSNWSVETALQGVAEALRTGKHYGYNPAKDDAPSGAVVSQPPNTDQISLFA